MKNRLHNPLIRRFYDYGLSLSYADKKPHWSRRNQFAASFIHEYFQDIPEAILLLEKVALDHFTRLTNPEQRALIEHHQADLKKAVQGPTSLEADNLWRQGSTSPVGDA